MEGNDWDEMTDVGEEEEEGATVSGGIVGNAARAAGIAGIAGIPGATGLAGIAGVLGGVLAGMGAVNGGGAGGLAGAAGGAGIGDVRMLYNMDRELELLMDGTAATLKALALSTYQVPINVAYVHTSLSLNMCINVLINS